MGDADQARVRLGLLQQSGERLDAAVQALEEKAVSEPSYDSEWTIAQVLSHLGSGAEIFSKLLQAAVAGEEPPGHEEFSAIWDAWNAKPAAAQANDYVQANAALLELAAGLDDKTVESASLDLWGSRRDVADLLGMRLNEHVLHSWDVLVALDDSAELLPEAVPSILDRLGELVGRAGKAGDRRLVVGIHTTQPEQELLLRVGDGKVTLGLADEEAAARLDLPAAALVRLVYGRLDADHTPPDVVATGVELDDLRAVFPGL
jgi:uncharacterized protein (TIGR03083 family)